MNPQLVSQTASPLLESEFDIEYRIPSADFDLSTIAKMCSGDCDAEITRATDNGDWRVSISVTVPQAEEQEVFARLCMADHLNRLSKKTIRSNEPVPDCTKGSVATSTSEAIPNWLRQIKSGGDHIARGSPPAQPSHKQEDNQSGIAGDSQQNPCIVPAAPVQQQYVYEQEAQPQQHHYEQDQYSFEQQQRSRQIEHEGVQLILQKAQKWRAERFGTSLLREHSIKRAAEQCDAEDAALDGNRPKTKRGKAKA